MLNTLIKFFLENKLVTVILLIFLVAGGIVTAPFGWEVAGLPKDPVGVDAIPDIGENQQIVYAEWPGRSPQDIEDQISYPLTTYLLGVPGVKSVRSSSIFGFSSIYVIFEDDVEFYWSRSRILEKLNSLPTNFLPADVQPTLGPDATALGQVFWYTLEGRDTEGRTTGGWDLHEIRAVQDYYVKYALNGIGGVAEVASIGGHVQEYQVDVDPGALQGYGIALHQVLRAVAATNRDVGAKTIELNQAEYIVRGLGAAESLADLEEAVVAVQDNVPVRVKDVGRVVLGPADRRGILDKGGAEVVGGVVVARYGANPLAVIQAVKDKIVEISPGLPQIVLADGTLSKLTLVPFYDRSALIYETLGTLEEALTLEILISILVVIVMVYNLRASFLISSLLPIAVLGVFIIMRYGGAEANVMALSGIAIAVGTLVDLGIVLSENILKQIDEAPRGQQLIKTVYLGVSEVSTAILTAVTTTIVSFIPVFTLQAAEGKLFGPLAFTKTAALVAALLVSLLILPTLAHGFFAFRLQSQRWSKGMRIVLLLVGVSVLVCGFLWQGLLLMAFGGFGIWHRYLIHRQGQAALWVKVTRNGPTVLAALVVVWVLASHWLPLGAGQSTGTNAVFVVGLLASILGVFRLLQFYYQRLLTWFLAHKGLFLSLPILFLFLGLNIWLGFSQVFGWLSTSFQGLGLETANWSLWTGLSDAFPGLDKEFMPSLDEGSFLLMPTSMPHAGLSYNREVLGQMDRRLSQIPEVSMAVGKLGRVASALDPAPISMFENVVNYQPEFAVDVRGRRLRFRVNAEGEYVLRSGGSLSQAQALAQGVAVADLIPDDEGRLFRNWRDHIRSPDDIWAEIVQVTNLPGVTSAPKLQPIETRLVMLQTGLRAPMGIKVFGPDFNTIQAFSLQLETLLKEVPSVKQEAVFADRMVGKPYLHLNINRAAIGRYGLSVEDVQQTIETAIGGMSTTSIIDGRARLPVRVRYPRELRDSPEAMANILVSTPMGGQIPLGQLVDFEYVQGPQAIRSEETFLLGFVLFDSKPGFAEVATVADAQEAIDKALEDGRLQVPAGLSYKFSGTYENQVRAEKRLTVIIPLVLALVFVILYFQFRSVGTALMVFSGIALAFSGGFMMLWLWGEPWFANISFMGTNLRQLFQMESVNLSVAVWVGFIALFGIATDDGVLMGTYLDQHFAKLRPANSKAIREAVVAAAQRRIRPAVMTSATTIIALLPILSSTGKGSNIMIPMAIPAFGGMIMAAITYFLVPVLYAMRAELSLKQKTR